MKVKHITMLALGSVATVGLTSCSEGEDGKPGYGLFDRAMGACYLYGLFEAAEREGKNEN
jgi:hypothetical protein